MSTEKDTLKGKNIKGTLTYLKSNVLKSIVCVIKHANFQFLCDNGLCHERAKRDKPYLMELFSWKT